MFEEQVSISVRQEIKEKTWRATEQFLQVHDIILDNGKSVYRFSSFEPNPEPDIFLDMGKRIQFRRAERSDLETQFWLRIFAFIIDSLIIRMLLVPAIAIALSLIPINVSGEIGDITSEGSLNSLKMNSKFLFGLYLTVFLLYSSILESSKLQGTLGKWFLRYKVCDTEFNRISFPKALLRNLLKVISILSLIGVVIIDMTPKRQGLHDLIVRTVLIRK